MLIHIQVIEYYHHNQKLISKSLVTSEFLIKTGTETNWNYKCYFQGSLTNQIFQAIRRKFCLDTAVSKLKFSSEFIHFERGY